MTTTTPHVRPTIAPNLDEYARNALDVLAGAQTEIATHFTCAEAETIAALFYAMGDSDGRVDFLAAHAHGDDDGDQHGGMDADEIRAQVEHNDYVADMVEDQPERGPASLIRVGDTVTVFAHTSPNLLAGTGAERTGTVVAVAPVDLFGTTDAGRRIDLTDADGGTSDVYALERAVTTWHGYHDARPDSGITREDHDTPWPCVECGRDVTWIGPSPLTDWKHTADQ